jgi:hypothetical protein
MRALLMTLFLLALFTTSAIASIKPITCKTNFGEKSFTIERTTIAFHSEDKVGRSISSVMESATQKSQKGFKKTTYKNGFKHMIHIDNENKFNQNEDFLVVTSPKGHKMTYPIICSRI